MIRQAIIDGIRALALGTFTVSSEMPWDAAGTPLYQNNLKRFFIGETDSEESALFNTLDGNRAGSLSTRISTVQVFVVVDAKQQPANFEALMTAVEGVKNTQAIAAVRSREVDRITTFEADTMITEFVFRFTELKIN